MTIVDATSRYYVFGQFRLDAVERVLFSNGQPLNLPPKVFDTLAALVVRSGHIVERDLLMSEVWKDAFVEEANLSVNISALRKTLGKTECGTDFIETVPRRGYRFRAEVSQFSDACEDDLMVIRRRTQARMLTIEVDDGHDVSGDERVQLSATNSPMKAIAVLPFRLGQVEHGDEFLSLGMADALIMQISNSSRITVRPIGTVKKYADEDRNPFETGRELLVDAVLDCSIYRIGNRMRVTAAMLETKNEITLWSDSFDTEFSDIFAVQDSIASQVARALAWRLNEREREILQKRYTTDTEAFREYLKGRYYWNKRDVEGFYRSMGHFKKAIDIDPTYALAYTGLADTYNMLPMWGEMSPEDGYVLANASALKALEIDTEIADAYASLGYTKYLYTWDWAFVEDSYKRAITLNPRCVAARNWYAKLCVSLRRFDEAHQHMALAFEIDPLSPMVASSVIAVYLYERRYSEAINRYSKLLATTPKFVPALIGLGLAYSATNNESAAISAHRSAVQHSAGNKVVQGVLAGTMARFGNREEPLRVIENLRSELAKYHFLSHTIAMIYANLEARTESFEWLERAVNERISHVVDLAIDPEFDTIRTDERFTNLLVRLALA